MGRDKGGGSALLDAEERRKEIRLAWNWLNELNPDKFRGFVFHATFREPDAEGAMGVSLTVGSPAALRMSMERLEKRLEERFRECGSAKGEG